MKVSTRLFVFAISITFLLITLAACSLIDRTSVSEEDVSERECIDNEENIKGHVPIFYADDRIDFAWLADSNHLVIGDLTGQLFLLTLTDETETRYEYHRILQGEFSRIYDPVASPNEQAIVFSAEQTPDEQGDDNSDWSIYRFDIDTNTLTQLSQTYRDYVVPWIWEANSNAVTISDHSWQDFRNLSVDGRKREQSVFVGRLDSFVWHPKGQDIMYADRKDGNIYQVNTLTGEVTQITNSVLCKDDPTWSPNGDTIAYISSDDGRYNLYLTDTHGKSMENLIHSEGTIPYTRSREYVWSPDGQQIAFSWLIVESYEKHAIEIYTINVDGSEMKQLTYTPGENESSPQWSPDGKRLAYLSYNEAERKTYINILTLADGHLIRLGPLDTEFP